MPRRAKGLSAAKVTEGRTRPLRRRLRLVSCYVRGPTRKFWVFRYVRAGRHARAWTRARLWSCCGVVGQRPQESARALRPAPRRPRSARRARRRTRRHTGRGRQGRNFCGVPPPAISRPTAPAGAIARHAAAMGERRSPTTPMPVLGSIPVQAIDTALIMRGARTDLGNPRRKPPAACASALKRYGTGVKRAVMLKVRTRRDCVATSTNSYPRTSKIKASQAPSRPTLQSKYNPNSLPPCANRKARALRWLWNFPDPDGGTHRRSHRRNMGRDRP